MHERSRSVARRPPHRGGFTLLEAVLVLMIVALMAGLVAPTVSGTQRTMSVDNARNAALFLGARARSLAASRGTVAHLEFDSENDRAWIRVGDDTLSDSRVDFQVSYNTDLAADATVLSICYSSKGYALFSCSSTGLPATLTFSAGSKSAAMTVGALGQMETTE